MVAVGVSRYKTPELNLDFSAADATLFANALGRGTAATRTVRAATLTDDLVTRENIMAALGVLAGGSKASLPRRLAGTLAALDAAKPEDAVLLFFSGHGRTRQGHFYFLPYDTTGSDGLDFSDADLEQGLERIDAESIGVIVDACSSGAALNVDDPRLGPLNQHGLQRLAYDKGVFFLTSSQTFQQAREYGQFGHGILTYVTVVEGLEQRLADREPRDGAVDLAGDVSVCCGSRAGTRAPEIRDSVAKHSNAATDVTARRRTATCDRIGTSVRQASAILKTRRWTPTPLDDG